MPPSDRRLAKGVMRDIRRAVDRGDVPEDVYKILDRVAHNPAALRIVYNHFHKWKIKLDRIGAHTPKTQAQKRNADEVLNHMAGWQKYKGEQMQAYAAASEHYMKGWMSVLEAFTKIMEGWVNVANQMLEKIGFGAMAHGYAMLNKVQETYNAALSKGTVA